MEFEISDEENNVASNVSQDKELQSVNFNNDIHNGDDNDLNVSLADDNSTIYDNDMATKLDTQRVIRLRLLLILTLIASATILSTLVHRYVTTNEKKHFEDKFSNDADKIFEAVGSSLERTMGVLNAFALAYVSYAADVPTDNHNNYYHNDETNVTSSAWPFVTLPNFALHASKLLPLTNGLLVSMLPLIYPSQKQQWEEYASQNDGWVNETLQIQEVWGNYYGETRYDWHKVQHISSLHHEVFSNVR
jgi:hypothetical protein